MPFTVSAKIKQPKLTEHLAVLLTKPETTRVCSHGGCEESAPFVGGHYTVGTRRVRVWVCRKHIVGNPNTELPVPANIQYALDKEEEFMAEQREAARFIEFTERSVITLASGGYGDPIPGDRVKAWRWGA